MKSLLIVLFACLGMIFLAGNVYATSHTELRVDLFVDATLGLNITWEGQDGKTCRPGEENEPECYIELDLGVTGGTFIDIINEANIRDRIILDGIVKDSATEAQATDWVKLAFICGETSGDCDDVPASEVRYVDNILVSPEIERTQVFAEMTGWKRYDEDDVLFLALNARSKSDPTEGIQFTDIKITITDPESGRGPLASPGLSNVSLLILLGLSGLVAYRKVI